MSKTIAIRREDKNRWERRAPLTPADVKQLVSSQGLRILVQPSALRIFPDSEYAAAGGILLEDIGEAEIILGIKEIPAAKLLDGKTYFFFSHTIKGQPYNMEMLAEMIRRKVSLIDYERITDDQGKRLIFFGRHAGLAGMIETLRAYGLKCRAVGRETPFAELKQPYEYDSLEQAKADVKRIGDELSAGDFLSAEKPLTIGISGYGNVSRGAQEIVDLLPCEDLSPADLRLGKIGTAPVLKVVYREQDMVAPLSGSFDLQDYYNNPGNYRAILEPDLQRLSILVNCIYWTELYPRLVTRGYLRENIDMLKLQVIGDISIDIEGAVEISHKATMPDLPSYTYLPRDDRFEDGVKPDGISVMAIDNLPCELSREATEEFSAVLREFLPRAADVDMSAGYEGLDLAAPLKRALILKGGEFPPDYLYMKGYLQEEQL